MTHEIAVLEVGQELETLSKEEIKQELRTLVGSVLDSVKRMAELYVYAVDKWPGFADEIRQDANVLPIWDKIESVGRGRVHPKLAFKRGAAYNSLRNLSLLDQERAISQGVKLISADGASHFHVKLENLQPIQVRQAFDGSHFRSEASQRAYLESVKVTQTKNTVVKKDYEIINGMAVVNRPMNEADLKNVLKELKEYNK